jgi:hypothetical protein
MNGSAPDCGEVGPATPSRVKPPASAIARLEDQRTPSDVTEATPLCTGNPASDSTVRRAASGTRVSSFTKTAS